MRAIVIARRSMYIENVKVFLLCGLQRLTAGSHCSDVFSVAGSGEQGPFWWGEKKIWTCAGCWVVALSPIPASLALTPVMLHVSFVRFLLYPVLSRTRDGSARTALYKLGIFFPASQKFIFHLAKH